MFIINAFWHLKDDGNRPQLTSGKEVMNHRPQQETATSKRLIDECWTFPAITAMLSAGALQVKLQPNMCSGAHC